MEKRTKAIIPVTALADHTGKEGYAILASGAVCSSATVKPLGIIVDGAASAGKDSVAVAGGNVGPVGVKLNATPGSVVFGSLLVLCSDGTLKLDPGTGARVIVAQALESGAADEIIEAQLLVPIYAGAHIADVGQAGATYAQSEVNAIADKINAVIAALELRGVLAAS